MARRDRRALPLHEFVQNPDHRSYFYCVYPDPDNAVSGICGMTRHWHDRVKEEAQGEAEFAADQAAQQAAIEDDIEDEDETSSLTPSLTARLGNEFTWLELLPSLLIFRESAREKPAVREYATNELKSMAGLADAHIATIKAMKPLVDEAVKAMGEVVENLEDKDPVKHRGAVARLCKVIGPVLERWATDPGLVQAYSRILGDGYGPGQGPLG